MASPEKKAFLLRIDPRLWARIERLAAAELRSANAQVEYLLRDALRSRGGGTAATVQGAPNASNASKAPVTAVKKPR